MTMRELYILPLSLRFEENRYSASDMLQMKKLDIAELKRAYDG
ncbi:MAG: hypothetical protein QOF89_1164 [Acidobacteriota bacterium]|jgi:hypothetical protein|nr:hypothetical protein [Acidobacteriota bacterium]